MVSIPLETAKERHPHDRKNIGKGAVPEACEGTSSCWLVHKDLFMMGFGHLLRLHRPASSSSMFSHAEMPWETQHHFKLRTAHTGSRHPSEDTQLTHAQWDVQATICRYL